MPTVTTDPELRAAIHTGMTALKELAEYELPPALDRLTLDLGERKDSLTPEEREQLLALVAFTERRTLEKLRAELALRQLRAFFPDEARA